MRFLLGDAHTRRNVSRNVVVLIIMSCCVYFVDKLWRQAVKLIVLLWVRRSLSSPLISQQRRSFSSIRVKIRDDFPALHLRINLFKITVAIIKWLNHAEVPLCFLLSSSLRSIVVYLLTEPCLVIQSSMFCTLTPQFNQGFCFVFAKKCVGCHIWMLPLHSWCVCTCGSSTSHSLRMFPAPDEDHCSESFLFGVDGSVTVLVSQWDRS